MTLPPYPVISNEPLLQSFLRLHPEYVRGSVCSCGKVLPMASMPGHISGSNRKWTIKAKFAQRHQVVGYTLVLGGVER
jgi:hypothetical protein